MTSRERIENLLSGGPADRVPFCPAVYEHKAALVGTTPSRLSRDIALFERAVIREIELYGPDLVTIGCDVYNVEAEASGCRVRFRDSNDVPLIFERAIRVGDDVSKLRLPEPERDGRMPVNLEAGRRIEKRFGRDIIVRGALSAPFSVACGLTGPEELYMALVDHPGWVSELLEFAAEVVQSYGRGFAERGLGVILFDSHASPPLVSPALYEKIILPPTARVVAYFRNELRIPLVPYIIGGDTTSLLDQILQTGTNNVLCDFPADLAVFIGRLQGQPVLLRANLDPRDLLSASVKDIKTRVRQTLAIGRRHSGFMLGTGILPYDMPPEKVLAVKDALGEF
jgi:uroporphyrinogen decarboxylase